MKPKKQSAYWNIAATHYLTAGFAMPFLVGLVINFTVVPLIPSDLSKELLIGISIMVLVAFKIIAVWLGVWYSARYLAKNYVIPLVKSI
jgi:hypothetical protein